MSQKYLHCLDEGTAYVSESDEKEKPQEVSVLPYEDGMVVIVRAELPNSTKRCTTTTVVGMADGAVKPIVDLAGAGDGAKVTSCAVKEGLLNGRPCLQNAPQADEDSDLGETAMPGEVITANAEYDDDDGTPAELWVSGVKNAPSAMPIGGVAFLIMQKYWYEEIECGMKNVEHRKQSKKYHRMFIDHHPAAVKLQCGYTNKQMIWEVVDVEDCGGDGIDIYLGKRIA